MLSAARGDQKVRAVHMRFLPVPLFGLSAQRYEQSTSKRIPCKDMKRGKKNNSHINDLHVCWDKMWGGSKQLSISGHLSQLQQCPRRKSCLVQSFCFEWLYTNLCIFSLVRAVPLLILSHPPIHLHQQNERVSSKHSGMVLQPHSSSPVTAFTIYCFSRPVSVL